MRRVSGGRRVGGGRLLINRRLRVNRRLLINRGRLILLWRWGCRDWLVDWRGRGLLGGSRGT